jgi:hypothetical protein
MHFFWHGGCQKDRWRQTLEEVDYGCNMVPSEGTASPVDVVEGTLCEGIMEFERIAEKY